MQGIVRKKGKEILGPRDFLHMQVRHQDRGDDRSKVVRIEPSSCCLTTGRQPSGVSSSSIVVPHYGRSVIWGWKVEIELAHDPGGNLTTNEEEQATRGQPHRRGLPAPQAFRTWLRARTVFVLCTPSKGM